MRKIVLAALLAALVCTAAGCNAKRTTGGLMPGAESGEQAPTATPVERVDTLNNPILTEYAEGTFIKAEDGKLRIDENGVPHEFTLSARAANDVTVLEIQEGNRIIVNYNILEDGTEEAESLEKILSE